MLPFANKTVSEVFWFLVAFGAFRCQALSKELKHSFKHEVSVDVTMQFMTHALIMLVFFIAGLERGTQVYVLLAELIFNDSVILTAHDQKWNPELWRFFLYQLACFNKAN